MATYRAIQPAFSPPTGEKPERNDEDDSRWAVGRRSRAAQACNHCRRTKGKCDGGKPRCRACTRKGAECVYAYDGDGRETVVDMRSRLQGLEQLVAELRAGRTEEAAAAGPRSTDTGAGSTPGSVLAVARGESNQDDTATIPRTSLNTTASPSYGTPASALSAPTSSSTTLAPASPYTSLLPDAATVERAVEAFFSCSGKLFHVFTPEQVASYHRAVFAGGPAAVVGLADGPTVCCLSAVAAIGAQYVEGTLSPDVERRLYDMSRLGLDAVLEERPLDAIKVCTLLCQYNVMSKATVALAYAEMGLSLCRRYDLHLRLGHLPGIPEATRVHYRRAWRTLMFFASWLAATLGYISANDFLSDSVALSELDIEGSGDISDIVQTELAKISLLKAKILQMHLVFRDLSVRAIESIKASLQEWYDQLPAELRLESTATADVPIIAKRSIFHVHLLYLGTIILLYRRMAAQFVRSLHANNNDRSIFGDPLGDLTRKYSVDAVLAATMSARTLQLLLEDNSIFKRCWLVIFQTYTSGIILLQCITQKQLHNLDPSTWQPELRHANICIRVLSFCGEVDPVAAKFHEVLSTIHATIMEHEHQTEHPTSPPGTLPPTPMQYSPSAGLLPSPEGQSFASSTFPTGADPPLHHLFDPPENADPARWRLSLTLLGMLCEPFGDPGNRSLSEELVLGPHWRADPTRYEYPQLLERLEWEAERRLPFHWDAGKLGLRVVSGGGLGGGEMDGNRFLGSSTPSGWMSADGSRF